METTMETRNFQKLAEQAAITVGVFGFGRKPRDCSVQKPTMTAHEFAEIWHVPINKNGVIVGPGGYIFQRPEAVVEKLYCILMRLPNTGPLLFQIGGCAPRPVLDGGKDNSAWHAIRLIGLSDVSDKGLRAAQDEKKAIDMFKWHFEKEFSERLAAILRDDQKYRNVISLPSRRQTGKGAA
jgi:hypothetical protein